MLDRPTKLKEYQTYIDGKWVDAASGKTFQTFDPYTGEPWALIPECDKADVDRAVEAAARAFETGPWPAMTPTARGKVMRRIAELIEKHAEHLAPDRGARQRQADLGDGGADQVHARVVLLLRRAGRQDSGRRGAGRPARPLQLHPARSRSACARSSRRGTRR